MTKIFPFLKFHLLLTVFTKNSHEEDLKETEKNFIRKIEIPIQEEIKLIITLSFHLMNKISCHNYKFLYYSSIIIN